MVLFANTARPRDDGEPMKKATRLTPGGF